MLNPSIHTQLQAQASSRDLALPGGPRGNQNFPCFQGDSINVFLASLTGISSTWFVRIDQRHLPLLRQTKKVNDNISSISREAAITAAVTGDPESCAARHRAHQSIRLFYPSKASSSRSEWMPEITGHCQDPTSGPPADYLSVVQC